MPARVSPSDRIHARIDDLFARDRALPEILEEVARLGAQLLMQAALEAEVTEFLGRDRYARAAAAGDARPGSRNGYREVTVKTTAGPVALARPKLRGTTEAFASRLFGAHVTKTNALESLVIAAFVRGLSVRDVEAALAEALGDQAAISKSTVSTICQAIKDEYERWAARRLDGVVLDYLFLDASFFKMHPGSPAEPVLAAWGITTGGKPAFVGLAPGSGESADAWHDFLTDLTDRGLRCPLLAISDGNAGLIGAIEQVFPQALRQRCLIHRGRKESTCRRAACCSGGEEVGRRAVAGRRLAGNVARLLEERESLADDVADGGPADVAEGVGEDVQGACSSLIENGEQDAFAVADLLREDASPGTGPAWAATPLISKAFGLGGLPGGEPSGEFAQFVLSESGQGGVG
jgi:transposase-like protein